MGILSVAVVDYSDVTGINIYIYSIFLALLCVGFNLIHEKYMFNFH